MTINSMEYKETLDSLSMLNIGHYAKNCLFIAVIRLQDLLKEALEQYFYHATTADRLPGIVQKGLIPSTNPRWGGELAAHSEGKAFVTEKLSHAVFYGNSGIWKAEPVERYRPIIRFKYDQDLL